MVASTPPFNGVGNRFTCNLVCGIKNGRNRNAIACAQIKRHGRLASKKMLHTKDVGRSEIHHMDIISDTRSIWRVIIIAKKAKGWDLAGDGS